LELLEVKAGGALGEIEHLDTDHLILRAEVQHDSWGHFLGLHDGRVVQAEMKGVGFTVNLQSHSLPFIVRSKYTLTTRSGTTVLFITTRNTRSPDSINHTH
jgi:hypothetical protein